MLNKSLLLILLISIMLFSCVHLKVKVIREASNIKLLPVFSNNMVLQRNMENPVWGTASPNSEIIIKIKNQEKRVMSDNLGNWQVKLDKMEAGGPHTLVISGKETIQFNNVMIGEVWIASGQSNMEMPLKGDWAQIHNCDEEIKSANYPNIRLMTVGHNISTTPLNKIISDGWVVCSPKTISEFSATAYFFGRNIHEKTNIPIGLIHSSWGGTVAEAWTSGPALKKMEEFRKQVETMEKGPQSRDVILKNYKLEFEKWEKILREKDAGINDSDTIWSKIDVDDSEWKIMKLPTLWENAGLQGLDGIVWFRKTITLPESMAGKDAMLNIGPCDDIDITWFNGIKVGTGISYNTPRKYKIPAELVKAGENVIAVRVRDNQGGGGIWGDPGDYSFVSSSNETIALNGDWRYRIGLDLKDIPQEPMHPDYPNQVMVLYNGMIHPLIPYGIRGAIWYQGESNADRGFQYRSLFKTMIRNWREVWGQGDFPFYFVQLANFMERKTEPGEDDWAELREAQTMALELPNTGMAVTIDIGNAIDIHPGNKQDVGKRLALWARKNIHNENIECSGPLFESMEIRGNLIQINFTHAEGLKTKGNSELKGFAISGKDGKFVWADAKIDGNSVLVSSPAVPKPVAVRYAWASNPECNLYNEAGLPASPFRTK